MCVPRLKDYPWWPTVWATPAGWFITDDEMIRVGLFQNARRVAGGLSLEAAHGGVICTARINSSEMSLDQLILLRHILLQHYREPMRIVADLEFDFRHLAVD